MIDKAQELCVDLIANVKEQYEEFKARPPRQHGGYGGHRGGGGHQGGYDRGYDHYSGGGRQSSHDHASHSPAPGASNPQATQDYYAQYAQYYAQNPSQDPYAQWGGYQKYVSPSNIGGKGLLTSQLYGLVPTVLCASPAGADSTASSPRQLGLASPAASQQFCPSSSAKRLASPTAALRGSAWYGSLQQRKLFEITISQLRRS